MLRTVTEIYEATHHLVSLLETYLLRHPDWSFGLAVANIISDGELKASLTYITDAEWVEALERLVGEA